LAVSVLFRAHRTKLTLLVSRRNVFTQLKSRPSIPMLLKVLSLLNLKLRLKSFHYSTRKRDRQTHFGMVKLLL
jgi:hypothetical protein